MSTTIKDIAKQVGPNCVQPSPSKTKRSPRTIQRWCKEGQRILRLQDWDVSIALVNAADIPEAEGTTDYTVETKHATICVADNAPDPQQVVIHELLHLHFAIFYDRDPGPMQVAQEQAIDNIADALISLMRKKKRV